MTWWVFANATAAGVGQARITSNMGIPVSAEAITRRWADLRATSDGKSAIPAPEGRHQTGIGTHEEVERPTWPVVVAGAGK